MRAKGNPDFKGAVPGGVLLVVEGVDGAGKSSVLKALGDYCEREGFEWLASREPTDGPTGKKIRASAQSGRLSLAEELDLFLQDRREHVSELIRPALERGVVVLLDRYYFSNAAYQGARGGSPEKILATNEMFAPQPDLVLLLDCSPEVSLERIRKRGSVPDEFERIESLEAVRRIFLSIQRPFFKRVDASREADFVARECEAYLQSTIEEKRRMGAAR